MRKKILWSLLIIGLLDFLGFKVIQIINDPQYYSFLNRPKIASVKGVNITPPQYEQLNIPLITQTKNLSCEAAAIKMVLEKFNKQITEDEIQSKFIYDKNPYKGFRGNVNGAPHGFTDYGAYAEPVAQVFAQYGIPTQVHYSLTEQQLQTIVQKGTPVIIWVNRSEKNPRIKDEVIEGEKVKLISGEHVVVVEGFSNGKWTINDPWSTTRNGQKVSQQVQVENLDAIHWNLFDHMALAVN